MKQPHSRSGNVLLVTVGLLAMVCTFAGIAFNTSGHTAQGTARSRDFAAAQAAAEGALEYAYAIWKQRIGTGKFASEAYQNLTPPTFPGVTYADEEPLTLLALDAYGVATTTGVPITGRVPGYVGWSGRTRNYAAIARVKLDDGSIIGVRRLFQYTEVPLFQSMFFFQHDLEFYRPATMVVNGLMHSNGTMYIRGDENSLTIQGNVTHHEGYQEVESPWAKYWTDGYMGKNWEGFPPVYEIKKEAQLNQVPAIQPMGGKPEEVFKTNDASTNNDGYRELIEPRDPRYPDPEAIASRRLINKASLIIEVNGDSASPTITVNGQGGASPDSTTVSKIRNSLSKTLGHAEYTYYEGNKKKTMPASGIYDTRESAWVDVTTLDMAKFKSAVENLPGFNNVVYIHDTTSRNSGDNVKTVRLLNGHSLPSGGLTIASENPVYVQGDYNTGVNPPSSTKGNKNNDPSEAVAAGYTRQPAAIIADAVMLLSNNWKDTNSSKALSSRVAKHTTYNMAILAGFMPSTDPVGNKPGSYSGGANNFPRFLEQWQNVYCTYLGSMVELFESEMFRGRWNTGNIYGAPLRRWNFDNLFLTTPPPGSVEAVVLNRGPWSRF